MVCRRLSAEKMSSNFACLKCHVADILFLCVNHCKTKKR